MHARRASLRHAFCLSGVGAALWFGAAWAAPVANGQLIRDFARISFEWAQTTTLAARMDGNRLIVTFDRRASGPDFSKLLARLPGIVKSASLAEDQRTLTLTLDKPYRTRSFISGHLNGVDLLGADVATATARPEPTAKTEMPKAEAPKAAPKKIAEAEPAKKPNPAWRPEPRAKPAPKVVISAPVAVAENEPPAKPVVAPAEKLPAPVPVAKSAPVAVAKNEPAAKTTEIISPPVVPVPLPKPAPTEPKPKPEPEPATSASTSPAVPGKDATPITEGTPAAPPAPQHVAQDASPGASNALAVTVQSSGGQIMLGFPIAQRVALAAFRRGGTDWLVFDRPLALNLDALKPYGAAIPDISVQHQNTITILRLHAPGQEGLAVARTAAGGWTATLSPVTQWPAVPLAVQARTDTAVKPHLLIAALETAPPVALTDPLVGDRLLVVPSYAPGEGIAPGRHLVDMELLPTAQGIALVPNGAAPAVVTQRNGLRIGTPEGLHLTPDLPNLPPAERSSTEAARPTLFPYDDWTPDGGIGLEAFRASLTPLMLVPGSTASEARQRLAQAYLSAGLAPEALGLIELTRENDLDFYLRERMSGLSGLANFLMNRMTEAARDFAAPELGAAEEVGYWRTTLAELTGRSSELFDYPHWSARYIRQYPPAVRARLGILAADRLVAANRFNDAIAVISQMKRDKPALDRTTQHALDYFLGEVFARTGYPDKAEEQWTPLIADMDDRYWRARAEFGRINMQLAQGKITDEQAMPRLDALRILWRDDPIELQVLKQLGALYLKHKNYLPALRTLREITQAYPTTGEAFAAAGQMADAFRYLYNEDGAKGMKPIEALALFYEFKDLTPVEAEGDKMIRNLADRLAEVDLLDRAAALLEHQVRYRLQGEERSRVGARLALLYLLNRQPQPALNVLELTGFGANPAELQQQRALLTARALADLHEGDRAVALLEDDVGPQSQLLKLDVYWDQGKWDKVVAVGESLLGQRRDPTSQLSDLEMGALLKLAVAYSFQKDSGQLRYLRDFFTPLVTKSPQKDLFKFLTADTPASPEGIAQLAQSIAQMQSFLSSYRTQIHQDGLSSAVK